jgi:hypothetical protein
MLSGSRLLRHGLATPAAASGAGSRRYVDEDGYVRLKPDWKPGDVVEL